MTLAERVQNRPLFVIGGAVFLLLLIGVLAVGFIQGTFLDVPAGCEWKLVEHPQTGETYTEFAEFEQDALDEGLTEEEFAAWQERMDTEFRDADGDGIEELHVKRTDCVGGVQTE